MVTLVNIEFSYVPDRINESTAEIIPEQLRKKTTIFRESYNKCIKLNGELVEEIKCEY